MFHDPAGRRLTGRRWASARWLCCSLHYPGSHRHPVWSRGYTQLFFLDEATSLAAGHRPCFECRRADAAAYREAVSRTEGCPPLRSGEIDARLHAERLEGRRKRLHVAETSSLPDGAMIVRSGLAWAVRDDRLLAWSHSGYEAALPRGRGPAEVLTPPTSLAALVGGYRPLWHPTAADPHRPALAAARDLS